GRLVHSVVVELESARAGSAHELSDAIEEIEAIGWSLDRLEPAMSAASHARPLILLVFRRA
ncbi:hypothetical protein ACFC1B_29610, partial [Streptomyces xiamenensis]|uniref:hypothetical protein n=1 Tax=Streptomyces xiamenensis TaxID=408015 RepID=UPI0035D6982F